MKKQPDNDHCQPLLDEIIATIHDRGKISFADYMSLALYHPRWGYYRSTLPKFGAQGDFITAPELSPLWGACVARWCRAEMAKWSSPVSILEFGAGSGRLAATLLRQLDESSSLPDTYYILELSAVLKARQKACLEAEVPDLLDRVVWLEGLPETPINGLVIANEVLDAMPVHLFQYDTCLQEVFVTVQADGQLAWLVAPPESPGLAEAVHQLGIAFPPGYRSEVNLFLDGWLKSLDACLAKGSVLLIDYGFLRDVYYHPQRHQGTVMCHYRHRAHPDPFVHVGSQDITAHVDFTHVQEAAKMQGFEVDHYTDQANFLIDWGLLDSVTACQKEQAGDALALNKITHQVTLLTSPTEMSTLFKVLVLTK